ncbi:methyl-accepting chemotaxis protein [Wukongibacter baidiensis]|uniref:methyl-accepting chemotaxis protein n=1 Tax=Wukongibacter baidiensis TaxID=1723361 RepID=UPI003D7FB9D5
MKWRFKDFNIRTKIQIGFLTIIIFCIILGSLSFLTMREISNEDIQLIMDSDSIYKRALEMRKNEKDFLLREVTNLEFFKTEKSKYIDNFQSDFEALIEFIELVKKSQFISANPEVTEELNQVSALVQEYHDDFLKVVNRIKLRGFKDYGLVGDLRSMVHSVEEKIEELPDNKDLKILMLQARRNEKDYFLRKDTKYVGKLTKTVTEFKNVVNSSNYDEKTKSDVNILMDRYLDKFNKVVAMDKEIGLKEDEGLIGEYRSVVHKVNPLIEKINHHVAELIIDNVKGKIKLVVITIVSAIAISLLLTFYISILITRPINKTNDMLKDIAEGEGDLTKRLEVNTKDELGILSKWFNLFVTKIKNTVTGVKQDADILSESTEELALAIDQANKSVENIANEINTISDGLQNNASIVEEATASVQEIASGTMIVSKESQNVAKNSEEVLKTTNHGTEKLRDVVAAIDRVKHSSDNMYDIIGELNDSSKQISEIISIITSISEQTNLLALNAAIEAARAGDHGKGFAVVAEEVRKLAEESKESAEKISLLINEIEDKTGIAYRTMKEEQELVEMSVEKANETSTEFNKILQLIEETVNKIKTISDSAVQQSEMVNQMTAAMNEISETTQNSAASTQQISMEVQEQVSTFEEIGASIEEMNKMANHLKEQTDGFKVI